MTKKQKKNLIRIIITSLMLIALIFISVQGIVRPVLYFIPYLIIGYDVLIKAGKGIINLQPFDECFLMSLATVGAFALGLFGDGDYTEAVAVMLFYQIGEWFQSYAVGKSRKNISSLMDLRPDYVNIDDGEGLRRVDPDEVEIGTIITVAPGERIPLDGIVENGTGAIDTSALTGESIPRDVAVGDEVYSGCIDLTGVLRIRTTKEFEESTAAKIMEMVENASCRKSRSEAFITKFARVYTPFVVISAVLLALVPPMIRGLILSIDPLWTTWLYRAMSFLVISCPCALVISIPLTFFAGIGGAGKLGILVKGANFLEMLSETGTVVFDKTGTLTKGVFEVTDINPESGITKDELLCLAASVEQYSNHPIALSLKKAAGKSALMQTEDAQVIAGLGIKAVINGESAAVGNKRMMESLNIECREADKTGTVVYAAKNGKFIGSIIISDVLKDNSREAVKSLRSVGVKKTVMLTGDNRPTAEKIAGELGLSEVKSELLPGDKVDAMTEILNNKNGKEAVVYVGDGINDAPVLTCADIGIAMGAMGSDAAIEASDIVLMDDDPMKLVTAIRVSSKCMRIVKENIYFAIGVKILCLVLGALGITNMWAAIFADVGVMIIAVLNAIRALMYKGASKKESKA